MPRRRVLVFAIALLGVAGAEFRAGAQRAGGPQLSRGQRQTLEALVDAVDRASAGGPVDDATWQQHVLRVSDGAHYVALRAIVGGHAAPLSAAAYVRVASRPAPSSTTIAERSAVKEWLTGMRSNPLPLQPGRTLSVPLGEMPVGGAAAASRRANEATDASSALRLQALQQERAARERAERDSRRAAELERTAARQSDLLPFEDFAFDVRPGSVDGRTEIRRGLTIGPGSFDVYIAWTAGQGRAAPVQVVRHRLELPAATTELALSDLIVAARVEPLAAPYPPDQQSSHPYAISVLDVTPALDNVLAGDGALGLVFQVINPAGSAAGKPDVDVHFEVSRVIDGRAVPFGALMSQRYSAETLPADFDTVKGHPLFGAVRASLGTFPRGVYRVVATAVDHVASRRISRDATFVVRATPGGLLKEAPVSWQAFRRQDALAAPVRAALAAATLPATPSPTLAAAVAALREGRFADVLQLGAASSPGERPQALTLLAAGLFGVGDSPRAVLAQLQQAEALAAPPAAVQFLAGLANAAQGDDRGAAAALLAARDAGLDARIVAPFLVDSYLRVRDAARATATATALLEATPGDPAARRALAATQIAAGRPGDALRTLDGAPDATVDDAAAFLVLHALFAGFAAGDPPLTTPGMRERFARAGAAYIAAGHPHAALVREWLAAAGGGVR